MKKTIGIRLEPDEELKGSDEIEHNVKGNENSHVLGRKVPHQQPTIMPQENKDLQQEPQQQDLKQDLQQELKEQLKTKADNAYVNEVAAEAV